MARIAGILSEEPPLTDELRSMLAAAAPGVEVKSTDGPGLLMGSAAGSVTRTAAGISVALDGTVYNRADFPRAASDAELVAFLYEKHGLLETLRRLNGDFALALFDESSRTLWIARDRFGIKPLYYRDRPGRFLFASRCASLLALPEVPSDVDRAFVARFAGLHYRCIDNEPGASPYAAIAQLPAATALEVVPGKEPRLHDWWTLRDEGDFVKPEEDLAAEYRALLLDAVRIRLESAPRRAFTLSGGMDSSSVLSCAVHLSGRKEQAFSTVYEDATYDESTDIRSILEAVVEEWRRVRVGTPDVFSLVDEMVAVHDEPVATATWLSHFLLCRAVREAGFTALFGGLGGDEINAGEYEHFLFHFADLRASGRGAELERETAGWIRHHDHPVFRKSAAVRDEALARLVDLTRPGICRPDDARLARYRDAVARDYFDLASFVPRMDHPFASYLKNRTWQDLSRETIPCCLRGEDRQAEAAGIENRLPFFDHRLAEFMFRVPGTMKFRDGVSKILLRRAMREIVPEETRTRVKKTGWNAPAHVWFSGNRLARLRDIVASPVLDGLYDRKRVTALLADHEAIVTSGRPAENHMMFFWQLVNLEAWLRHHGLRGR